jgi:hypothetical protein
VLLRVSPVDMTKRLRYGDFVVWLTFSGPVWSVLLGASAITWKPISIEI